MLYECLNWLFIPGDYLSPDTGKHYFVEFGRFLDCRIG
jgi:hypothetical protein